MARCKTPSSAESGSSQWCRRPPMSLPCAALLASLDSVEVTHEQKRAFSVLDGRCTRNGI